MTHNKTVGGDIGESWVQIYVWKLHKKDWSLSIRFWRGAL